MQKVKIRIAVAVDSAGQWVSSGWSDLNKTPTDQDLIDNCLDGLLSGENHYFLEAELEIPEAKTIQAEIKEEIKEESIEF